MCVWGGGRCKFSNFSCVCLEERAVDQNLLSVKVGVTFPCRMGGSEIWELIELATDLGSLSSV